MKRRIVAMLLAAAVGISSIPVNALTVLAAEEVLAETSEDAETLLEEEAQ